MESQSNLTSPTLCAGGCGFYGSAENKNLCSKCYKDLIIRHDSRSSSVVISELSDFSKDVLDALPSLKENGSCSSVNKQDSVLANSDGPCSPVKKQDSVLATSHDSSDVDGDKKKHCQSCSKRIRLLGFNCRCGYVFCGDHRYPEKHSCTFDYKKKGREVLAEKNPLIKSVKLGRRA